MASQALQLHVVPHIPPILPGIRIDRHEFDGVVSMLKTRTDIAVEFVEGKGWKRTPWACRRRPMDIERLLFTFVIQDRPM